MPAGYDVHALPGTGPAASLAHPGFAAAAGAALIAVLAIWAVTAFRARKRITWAVDLDMPVGLAPGQAPGAAWTMIFGEHSPLPAGPDPDGAAQGWLVLIAVTNTGLMPVHGKDFRVPLAFRFPGREVCAARTSPGPGSLRPGCRPPVLPTVPGDPGRGTGARSSRAPGIALGSDLLLNRNDAFTLMAVLRGMPARALPPVSQEGSLPGGTIAAVPPDGPRVSKWGTACAAATVFLAAMLLGLLLSAGS
jgi:hypothetical protein